MSRPSMITAFTVPVAALVALGGAALAVAGAPGPTAPVATTVEAPAVADSFTVPGMSDEVWSAARSAFDRASAKGEVERPILTVIDYSLPSTVPRLWVVDLEREEVLFHELVSHGQGTGDLMATAFSNREGSHQSSLGVFRAAETYTGKHGLSLRLDGLEPGINDAARARAIVIHGADYVSEAFVAAQGRLGRSWGCPAVRSEISKPLIETLTGGSLVVAHYPDADWLARSDYLAAPDVTASR